MGYKIKGAFKKGKPVFIVMVILWFILAICAVAPITVGMIDATGEDGSVNFGLFIESIYGNVNNFWDNQGKAFSAGYIDTHLKNLGIFTIGLFIFGILCTLRLMPKHEYTDVEHGSSDWCEGGEQYKVLSKNKGILLAEDHYLPVDKRGNTNVLVVGRIRFW